jgi:D-beta-D-heptose 7-phosphate kinase/D-beta-D-heptose 1-phosphate adenosyltransferase
MNPSVALNFQSVCALVIGDIILDHYLIGKVERISPEAPVPIVHVASERYVLGGSANVAANLSKLECKTFLFGAVGEDAAAQDLVNLCTDAAIEMNFITADMPTIRKTRVIGGKQQIVRIDWEKKFTEHELALNRLADCWSWQPNVVVLSDYGKGIISDELAQRTINKTNELSIPLVIDPKGINWEKYRNGFIVTPNLGELAAVYGQEIDNTDQAVSYAGKIIMEQYGLQNLLVTRSENGMTLISPRSIHHFPSHKVEVFDVSGAGDTVVAVLAASLASAHSLYDSVDLANKAGGYVVSKFGTYAISAQKLRAL